MTTPQFENLNEKEQDKFVAQVIDIIISANHTIFKIEQFKHSPAWLKELKNYGNLFLKRLMKTEREFEIIASDSENMEAIYNDFHDFMDEVNKVPLGEVKKYTELLKRARLDGALFTLKAIQDEQRGN